VDGRGQESCRLAIIFSDWESSVLINQLPCLVHMLKLAISLSFGSWPVPGRLHGCADEPVAAAPGPKSLATMPPPDIDKASTTRKTGCQSRACHPAHLAWHSLRIWAFAIPARWTTRTGGATTAMHGPLNPCAHCTPPRPLNGDPPRKGVGPKGGCRDNGAGALGSQSIHTTGKMLAFVC
jgi:hypothetical protein